MLRWSLFSIAVLFLGLGLLTVFRSPDWNVWQLALLAGEFGHWLAMGALTTLVVAWFTRTSGSAATPLTLLFAACATILLCKPTFEARQVAEFAKIDLDAMGAPEVKQVPFSFVGWFKRAPNRVPVEMITYAKGLELDFYRAVGRTDAPCVIAVHGGGWDSGNRSQLSGLNHWLAHQGYAVAAISYRLAPRFPWPAQRDDTLAAIAYLKANAAQLGIDASRLVLLGRSAGGQIAESVGYSAHDPAIRAVVGLYAPSDLRFAYKYARDDDILKSPGLIRRFAGGGPDVAGPQFESASAMPQVTAGSPPTLLVHGELDTLVWHRHSIRLDAVLERHGVPHVFVSLPWATHAFEYNLAGPGGQLTTYALDRFLKKVTASR